MLSEVIALSSNSDITLTKTFYYDVISHVNQSDITLDQKVISQRYHFGTESDNNEISLLENNVKSLDKK